MSLAKGVLGSVIGGVVGGALWVGISYATKWEFGLLAIVVGGTAGFGMGMGNQGRGGRAAGVAAALVAALSVLGAKFMVAHLLVKDHIASTEVTYEDARSYMADEIYMQMAANGTAMSEADYEDDYPPEVQAETDRRWRKMSDQEQEEYRAAVAAEQSGEMQQAAGLFTVLAFLFSFGIFGLVCLFFSVSTAYKIGSTVAKKEAEEGILVAAPAGRLPVDNDAPAGHAFFTNLGRAEDHNEQGAPPAPPTPPAKPRPAPAPKLARPASSPKATPDDDTPSTGAFFANLGRKTPPENEGGLGNRTILPPQRDAA